MNDKPDAVCPYLELLLPLSQGFPGDASDTDPACQCRRQKRQRCCWCDPWVDPVEREMASHSSIFVCEIPWTEEPGRLQSMGSQRVGHDWNDLARTHAGVFLHFGMNWASLTHLWHGWWPTLSSLWNVCRLGDLPRSPACLRSHSSLCFLPHSNPHR